MLLRLSLALVLALAGCGSDDSTTGPTGSSRVDAPESPGELVAALDAALASRDLDAYATLLHDDFRFEFSAVDRDAVPTLPPELDRATELAGVGLMFGGSPTRSDVVSVEELEVLSLTPVTPWSDVIDDDAFSEASVVADLDARLAVQFPSGTMGVRGRWRVYLTRDWVDGRFEVRILGWKDLGVGRVASDTSDTWGRLKARYLD